MMRFHRLGRSVLCAGLAFTASCSDTPASSDHNQRELSAAEKPQSPPRVADPKVAKIEIEYTVAGGISGGVRKHFHLFHNAENTCNDPDAKMIDGPTAAAVLKLLEEEKFWSEVSNVNPQAMDMIDHGLRVTVNDQVHDVCIQTGSATLDTMVDKVADDLVRALPLRKP